MILAVIALILMIIIHEFGHFSVAKLLHVPVYEFAVGMGPKICSKKGKSETTYSLRWIPIGGFCSFDNGDVTGIADLALNKQPIWKRVLILLGGAGFNLISAFIMAIIVCAFIGLPHATTKVHSIMDERADSFFQVGDEVISINGVTVDGDFYAMLDMIQKTDGTATFTVIRDGKEVTADANLFDVGGEWKLGVGMYSENIKCPPAEVLPTSFLYCVDVGTSIFKSLGDLFTGKAKINDLTGVVGVVAIMGDAAKENIRNILSYFILISINLGIFNLLPIPVLDGSKILFCAYEAVFKKRIPEKLEESITATFAAILILLMLYVTIHDVIKIF